MKNLKYPHPVFVLDVQYNGYGIARTFSRHGIKVVGFFNRSRSYEYHSRLLHKFVYLDGDDQNDFRIMKSEAALFDPYKPVLVVTSDLFQEFVRKFYNELKEIFIFEIPVYDTLKVFIEKDLFKELAVKLNVSIPFSYEIRKGQAEAELKNRNLTFPLIIKPKYRDLVWVAKYPTIKVFVAANQKELDAILTELFQLVDKLVLQEWIPGPDSNIYYCMAYIKPNGEVLETFCGRKIHQYPILVGNTSSAEAVDEPWLLEESIRILKANGNYGFCSVEFKKHNETGQFYCVEPTVGRINQQEITAALNGNDIVLQAYCYLAGVREKLTTPKVPGYYYVDEMMELQSCFEYSYFKKFKWSEYFKNIRKRPVRFLYLNRHDIWLSLIVIVSMLRHTLYFLFKGRGYYKSRDEDVIKLINTFPERASQF